MAHSASKRILKLLIVTITVRYISASDVTSVPIRNGSYYSYKTATEGTVTNTSPIFDSPITVMVPQTRKLHWFGSEKFLSTCIRLEADKIVLDTSKRVRRVVTVPKEAHAEGLCSDDEQVQVISLKWEQFGNGVGVANASQLNLTFTRGSEGSIPKGHYAMTEMSLQIGSERFSIKQQMTTAIPLSNSYSCSDTSWFRNEDFTLRFFNLRLQAFVAHSFLNDSDIEYGPEETCPQSGTVLSNMLVMLTGLTILMVFLGYAEVFIWSKLTHRDMFYRTIN